jgi:uncharacterized protein YjbI with pentapeptide repeats/tetratricopeptide (TPR) repeat protein
MAVALPEGSLAGRDLSGRDLTAVDLSGRDLAGADLRGATLDDANLADTNLAGAQLQGAGLSGASLLHADLTDAVLDDANLADASLAGTTLVRTSFRDVSAPRASFANAEWRETQARGGDWAGANLGGGSMHRVTLEGVSLRGANLAGLHLDDCDLRRVALDEAHADDLVAVDTSFERVTWTGASLRAAAFRFADLNRADLRGANLQGASFESVDFRSPWLEDISAAGARFERCAGLGREARRQLREGGADLPQTLVSRVGSAARAGIVALFSGALTSVARLARLVLVLALLAGLGWGLWTQRPATRPDGPAHGTPQRPLSPEESRIYADLQTRFELEPGQRLAILMEMGTFLRDAGADKEAEVRLREALEMIERDEAEPPVEPVLALSDLLLEQERFDDALAFVRELDQPGASAREIALSRLILAQTLLARGDPERAVPVAEELLAHIAAHPTEAPRFRLRAARVVEDVIGAAEALPLVEDVPASLDLEVRGEIDLERAALLTRLGNVAAALEAYDDLLLRLDDLPVLRERAREERARLLQTGTDAEAEERRLTELLDGADLGLAAVSALGLARLAVRRGDTDEGRRRYERALRRFGDQGDVRLRASMELSELLAATGSPDQAEAILREQLTQVQGDEASFTLRQALAEQRQQGGDLPGALTLAEETVAWAPDRSLMLRAKLQLAGLCDDAARFDQAIDLYKEVALAEEDPAMTAAAWFGQATLMRRRGFPEAALPLMDSALMHLPRQHRQRGAIVVERAEVLAELGRSSPAEVEAMLADARAARLDIDQPVAYATLLLRLGTELAEAGRDEDALNVFEQVAASAAAGEDPTLRQQAVAGQVAALVGLGRQEQAQELLDRVSLDSVTAGGAEETCEARDALARGRLEAGAVDAAVDAFSELLGACRSPRFLIRAVPEFVDGLVEAKAEESARTLLVQVRDDGGLPAVGRQVAALELGKLGSAPDLAVAADGPDEALAALARIETGRRLADAGEVTQARAVLRTIADDASMEPVPRGLARFELGMLAKRERELGSASVWFSLVRDESSEGWLRAQAESELAALAAASGPAEAP